MPTSIVVNKHIGKISRLARSMSTRGTDGRFTHVANRAYGSKHVGIERPIVRALTGLDTGLPFPTDSAHLIVRALQHEFGDIVAEGSRPFSSKALKCGYCVMVGVDVSGA